MEKVRDTRICIYLGSMAVFLFSFSEMVNAQSYAREKYSKIMWNYLEVLSGFGPRYVGTKGYSKTLRLIKHVGAEFADEVIEHPFFVKQHSGGQRQMINVEFVFHGNAEGRPVLLGAHYDTRPFADQESDPTLQTHPIIGSNDGGSGTSVLLGLAQYLKKYPVSQPVSAHVFSMVRILVEVVRGEMFLGSKHHADYLRRTSQKKWPLAVIIVDMVGDKDLEIFKETHSMASGPKVLDRIYSVAKRINSFQF